MAMEVLEELPQQLIVCQLLSALQCHRLVRIWLRSPGVALVEWALPLRVVARLVP